MRALKTFTFLDYCEFLSFFTMHLSVECIVRGSNRTHIIHNWFEGGRGLGVRGHGGMVTHGIEG